MCDTCRACCNADYLCSICRGCCGCCCRSCCLFLAEAVSFLVIDQSQEFINRFCCYKCTCEFRIHEHCHEVCKNFEVCVSCSGRCCDHEEQVAVSSVDASVINTFRYCHCYKTRLLCSISLCMRNSNAHAYSSGSLSLSGLDGLLVASLVIKVAYLVVETYQNVDRGVFISRFLIQQNSFLLK